MSQSLQCPRCNGSVTVADHAAGQRVECPHCQQTFLAPGIAPKANDDDDWLMLDEIPDVASPIKPPAKLTNQPATPGKGPTPSRPSTQTPASSGKRFSPEEEALLAEFASDLDDFTAELESPPPPIPPGPPLAPTAPIKPVARSQSKESPSPQPTSPQPAAQPVEYASEYRVVCNTCGSFLYAKASQAGKTVKCSDCYSPIVIPPPPKVRKKFEVNLDEAESFTFEANPKVERRPDPYQKSADALLEEAAREEDTNKKPTYDDTPDVLEWLRGIFAPFKDLGVLAHLLGLIVLGCIPAVIVMKIDSPILVLGLFPAGFFLALLTISCGMAILQSVANEEPSVTDWPTLDPLAWLGQLFVVGAAATVAAVPIWIICMLILGPQLLSVAITMLSIYVLFPFVLLSMLDMNSPFIPFSGEVARSVTKCEEAWGGFYFSSGLLFVGLFLVFSAASAAMSPTSGAVLAIAAGIAGTFMYFGMMGRLAYSIGQAVNAPPRRDEVDRSRHTDTA
jgi:DNA-directed RNA polymerase subunit M/transcription elongation factor TFIIS